MKLLTHNMLTSKCLKGVTVGYPLGIEVIFCCFPLYIYFQLSVDITKYIRKSILKP